MLYPAKGTQAKQKPQVLVMTSRQELVLTWQEELSAWLPQVITNLTLEFMRVDHVVRIATPEEFGKPDLDNVRRWLFAKAAPSDLVSSFLWTTSAEKMRDPHVLAFGKRFFDDNIPALSKGSFPKTSSLGLLPRTLVARQDDSCHEKIWREFERMLLNFTSLVDDSPYDDVFPTIDAFFSHLSDIDRALAFDSETGACFSLDRGSRTNVHRLADTEVLVATEQAWKHRQGSFLLRDNVVAIVDIVDEDGTTRVAFDYPASEHD